MRQQIVLLTAAVTAVAMVLLTVVLQIVLARVARGDVDRVLEDRADSIVAATGAASSHGELEVPDAALDPGVAVFDGAGDLVAGDTPRSLYRFYDELAESRRARDISAPGRRVRSQPFTTSSGSRGVVVVEEDLDPYEEAERLALIVTLVTGSLATGAAAWVAAWATRRALRPVAEMANTASEWSEHDLARRFSLGEPDNELTALAGTLDRLLDKVTTAIRSEQRLTSELAHELRTPLTAVQGTAELLLLRESRRLSPKAVEDLHEITAASHRMATTITTLLDLARSEPTISAASHCQLADVVADVLRYTLAAGVEIQADVADARLALPEALAVRTLSPVVENAARFAAGHVRITSAVLDGLVDVSVVDDGDGVDPALAPVIFEPGRTSRVGATGLGLAISRRIARAAGGDVQLIERTHSGGAHFLVRLPRD